MPYCKRVLLSVLCILPLLLATALLQGKSAYAAQNTHNTPTSYSTFSKVNGSCTETISDDAQLFGNRLNDVLSQAQSVNNALQADTRVVTVSTQTLGNKSPNDYYSYVQTQCPAWSGQNFIVFVIAKGFDPFLHLGSNFNGKMTSADYQQLALSVRSQLQNGNYAQGTITVMQGVQKQLSPNYSWLWTLLIILVVVVVVVLLAFFLIRRRQTATLESSAREQAMAAKQSAVDAVDALGRQSKELAPRIEILLALVPPVTANSLRSLFQTAQGQQGRIEEHLGNLLSSLDAKPSGASQLDYYRRMQLNYHQVTNETQAPQHLFQGVETAVRTLEQNPQAQVNFRQLTMQNTSQQGLLQ